MSDSDLNSLLDASLRRKLTPSEQAQLEVYLTAHPHERPSWEDDLGLNCLLRQLPDKPLASNFSAQVLQGIAGMKHPQTQAIPAPWRAWLLPRRWAQRIALASLIASAGFLSFYEYQHHTRSELAHSIAKVSKVTNLVTVDMLKDFDAINRFGLVSVQVDEELYRVLQ